MYFSAAASSENDSGSMNLASKIEPVASTRPSSAWIVRASRSRARLTLSSDIEAEDMGQDHAGRIRRRAEQSGKKRSFTCLMSGQPDFVAAAVYVVALEKPDETRCSTEAGTQDGRSPATKSHAYRNHYKRL
jgi:hypothetical protein